ncbi:MAG: hypothetical protein QNJ06_02610 [Kiloniellales bacterium]|nr:hypothetical protein [Kiloniellales bacterium]MDJ0968765.1 hypothetical protein [Kiloniellales bacterium]MDJ0981453.1 hypothetical protein [Kiloniellales bacterium]
MKKMPYRARTASGDSFDIDFPLHDETRDAVRVGQLLSTVLEAIDKDIALGGDTSNGDVLQAVAMAMAVRSRMIASPQAAVEVLSLQLLRTALAAAEEGVHHAPQVGHA